MRPRCPTWRVQGFRVDLLGSPALDQRVLRQLTVVVVVVVRGLLEHVFRQRRRRRQRVGVTNEFVIGRPGRGLSCVGLQDVEAWLALRNAHPIARPLGRIEEGVERICHLPVPIGG